MVVFAVVVVMPRIVVVFVVVVIKKARTTTTRSPAISIIVSIIIIIVVVIILAGGHDFLLLDVDIAIIIEERFLFLLGRARDYGDGIGNCGCAGIMCMMQLFYDRVGRPSFTEVRI